MLGKTLDGRFRIDQAIGQGAMGTVFAATQLSVNRRVAVKVLREQLSETSKARFLREARAISSLSHPNIVQLIEFGERGDDELLFLVMEFVEGVRLSRLNRRGRLHPNLAIELIAQICSALAEAHSQGIIHRDLKPSNLLLVLTADGSVQLKVLDFGVAHTYEDASELTATGVLCGTPAYMAPEQAAGTAVTPRVDIYALGVNLYEMLVGFRPFASGSPIQVAMQQIQNPPPSLRPWLDRGLVPAPLVALCEELLAKDPNDRPQSASEIRRRLLAMRGELGWGPVVVQPGEDPWKNWTQPKLGKHGGEPLDATDESGRSRGESWSGSWTGFNSGMQVPTSQQAYHDKSGLQGAVPANKPSVAPAAGTQSAASTDSMPSRHGGGWDAFRGHPTTNGHPAHAMNAPQAPPDQTAGPADRTVRHTQELPQGARSSTERGPVWPGQTGGARPPSALPNRSLPSSAEQPSPGPVPSYVDQTDSFVDQTSSSYQDVWQTGEGSDERSAHTFHDVEHLEVNRPPPERSGTVVSDFDPEGLSSGDLVRFGIVMLLVFVVCAVIGAAILAPEKLGLGDELSASLQDENVAAESVSETPSETPSQTTGATPALAGDVEKAVKKQPKVKPKPKKKWQEPIDVFDGDPPPDSTDGEPRKIVIDRGTK